MIFALVCTHLHLKVRQEADQGSLQDRLVPHLGHQHHTGVTLHYVLLLHLVEVVGELHVVVDEVAQGGLLGSRQLLLERGRNIPGPKCQPGQLRES